MIMTARQNEAAAGGDGDDDDDNNDNSDADDEGGLNERMGVLNKLIAATEWTLNHTNACNNSLCSPVSGECSTAGILSTIVPERS